MRRNFVDCAILDSNLVKLESLLAASSCTFFQHESTNRSHLSQTDNLIETLWNHCGFQRINSNFKKNNKKLTTMLLMHPVLWAIVPLCSGYSPNLGNSCISTAGAAPRLSTSHQFSDKIHNALSTCFVFMSIWSAAYGCARRHFLRGRYMLFSSSVRISDRFGMRTPPKPNSSHTFMKTGRTVPDHVE